MYFIRIHTVYLIVNLAINFEPTHVFQIKTKKMQQNLKLYTNKYLLLNTFFIYIYISIGNLLIVSNNNN